MTSTLYVDNLQPNLGSQVEIPNLKPLAGQVVQVQTNQVPNYQGNYTNSALSYLSDWYVDITPKNANNILVWKTAITIQSSATSNYARFAIYDALSNTKWNSNLYIGTSGYGTAVNVETNETILMHSNTAGTTSPLRLQLYLLVSGGGTIYTNWSSNDTRLIEVMEIAQ